MSSGETAAAVAGGAKRGLAMPTWVVVAVTIVVSLVSAAGFLMTCPR